MSEVSVSGTNRLLGFGRLRVGLQPADQRHVVPRLPLLHPVAQHPLDERTLPLNRHQIQDGVETDPQEDRRH